eukprot:GHVN01024067.1.p1 GENE.GHVN01024067.1~~GHVN01024067.1.p1  ORF type:complete len:413 (+),score=44.81 GHVN01024067.1:2185-3423(+)
MWGQQMDMCTLCAALPRAAACFLIHLKPKLRNEDPEASRQFVQVTRSLPYYGPVSAAEVDTVPMGCPQGLISLGVQRWAAVDKKVIRVFNNDKKSKTLQGHRTQVYKMESDGFRRLVSVDTSEMLIVWDVVMGKKLFGIDLLSSHPRSKLSSDGSDDTDGVTDYVPKEKKVYLANSSWSHRPGHGRRASLHRATVATTEESQEDPSLPVPTGSYPQTPVSRPARPTTPKPGQSWAQVARRNSGTGSSPGRKGYGIQADSPYLLSEDRQIEMFKALDAEGAAPSQIGKQDNSRNLKEVALSENGSSAMYNELREAAKTVELVARLEGLCEMDVILGHLAAQEEKYLQQDSRSSPSNKSRRASVELVGLPGMMGDKVRVGPNSQGMLVEEFVLSHDRLAVLYRYNICWQCFVMD